MSGLRCAVELPTDVTLAEREVCDLAMFELGGFAPLTGYMTQAEFDSCVKTCRLSDGGPVWAMPFVLPVPKASCTSSSSENAPSSENASGGASASHSINLRDVFGTVLARVSVSDVWQPDLDAMFKGVVGSTEESHPWVRHTRTAHGDCYFVGGEISITHAPHFFDFSAFRKSASETRAMFSPGDVVVGFQTRNPMHRSHFELTVQSLREAEERTGKRPRLLLMPACGPTQPGDIPAHVRVRCYKRLLPLYAELGYQADLILLPLAMRMAGPREALWHACIRKNFGCTHFIVGRDHAGPSARRKDGSPFYGPYDAHELVGRYAKEVGIEPLFGKNMCYMGPDRGYLQEDKLAAGETGLNISGTQFRQMMRNREQVPEWYSPRPVVEELQRWYRKKLEQGFCLYFTGLPCSGKSTLACAVEAALHERDAETRKVTYLDADIIRTHLSRGLGFTKEDRSANVRRIGFVAGVAVRHGGICLVANIAPYAEDRAFNRAFIEEQDGGYIEVHVSTPLAVCETRDVKGLYKKARQGVIKQFTGISDPYEAPVNPELVVDSSTDIRARTQEIIKYLVENDWIL